MSLFPSTLTGRVLDDGVTEPPVIELQGISAGQLATVLTQYTPLETTTQNTADIGTNAAAIAALQGQVAALPAAPDLTPYALAADLAAAEGLVAANAAGLTAVNTSLTLGLASKAALDALQAQVDGKSTPASVDLKLANHPTTAAMNSSIASTNNATLATIAATYALKSVVDQLAIDVAARQTAADVDQRVATALLSYLTQTALRHGRAGDLSNLQVTLQSAIDGILAEIATLGGATNLVNAPAWVGNVTWDLLAGTNQIRNLHATGPLSIQLANDDWTLSFSCDAYTTQQTDDAIAAALTNYFTRAEVTVTVVAAIDESKAYTDTQLTDYSTTTQMTQAISDALVPFETAAQRDAAIAAAPAAYYTSVQTDAAIAAAIAPYYTSAQTDAAIAAAVALSNGQSWTGGPTFNLLRGSNVLRNLSVAGALTASFQNLDNTILIESDSYARSETYTQLETGAAITAAIDALNLSQYRTEAQVLALIAGELVPYWDQTEVSTYVAGELANYATSSSVTSAISSALSSYDNSSQVDSKIITALLDFYTRAKVDQAIADATSGSVDLSNYYTQAETQSYVANELLAFYPRTELDSQLTATFTQYWTSSRTQTEIDDAIAGAGFLTQALADQRYFAVSANASFESLVRTNVTPPMIKALLPRAPLAASTILTDTTLELTCDAYTKAESDGRYLSSSSFAPLDARYFARNPAVAEGNGIFHLVQEQFTPQFIRSLLFRPPLTGGAILGNGSHRDGGGLLEQGPERRPLPAGGDLQLPRKHGHVHRRPGHRPGERPWHGPHGGPHRQLAHGHELRPDAPAAKRRGGPADQERHHDDSRRRRHAGGQLRRRQHRAGAGHHRPVGPDAQRHYGGLRSVLRGLHGGHRGLHEQQLHHRHAADRERPAGPGAAAALRSGGQRADRHRRDPGRAGKRYPARERGDSSGSEPALFEPVGGQQRRAGAEPPPGADRRGAQQFRGHSGHSGTQRRGHGRRDADPGQQRAERAGGAQGARRRRRADEHSLPVHELQHHQRPRQPGDRTEHRRQQQRGADLRLRLREPLGQGTQDERPGPLGEGAPGDLRCRGAPNVRPHRGGQGPDRLHRPGGASHPSGREGLQDEEPGRSSAHDARLPEAQRGPLGRGEVPAEEGGEAGEEKAKAFLKWQRTERWSFSGGWPGTPM